MSTSKKRGVPLPSDRQYASKKVKTGPSDDNKAVIYIDHVDDIPTTRLQTGFEIRPTTRNQLYDTCFGLVYITSHLMLLFKGANMPSSCVWMVSLPRNLMRHPNVHQLA